MDTVMTGSAYTIRTETYEGPFGLLLDLIQERKLLVNDLSLAQVTDDFIQHVKGQADFPIEDTADFIQVAATLLLIKSKSLIPDLELSGEEEEDVDDLKRRLLMYEKVREGARALARIFGKRLMQRAGERAPEPIFAPSKDFTVPALKEALTHALAELEKLEKLPEARVRPMVTLEDMMERLLERVQKALTLSWSEFKGEAKERIEIVVFFLALLELMKQGHVDAYQHETFSDIRITNTSPDVPKYG